MTDKTDWKGLSATLPGVGAALLPQLSCPACWPAYTALLSSLGVGFINYSPWLLPGTLALLMLAVIMLFVQARKQGAYVTFFVGFAAAVLIGVGKFVLAADLAVYSGAVLLFLVSLYNAWPKKNGQANSCSTCEADNAEPQRFVDHDEIDRLNETLIDSLVPIHGNTALTATKADQHQPQPILQSVFTCPACGFAKEETMPTDSCQYFYECSKCHKLFKPLPGDCCVFCSYGSVPCPPVQLAKCGC